MSNNSLEFVELLKLETPPNTMHEHSTKYVKYYASKVYTLNKDDLSDLSNFLFHRIKTNFVPVMKAILAINYPKNEISYLNFD